MAGLTRAAMLAVLFGVGCSDGGTPVTRPCATDADCENLEDGDLCNGTLRCVVDGEQGQCRLDPATVVSCDPAADTVCAQNRCDPGTGACAMTPVAEGTPCEDGDPCSYGDRCAKGSCNPGAGNLCFCREDADCPSDGDACNGENRCDKSSLPWICAVDPTTVVQCDASADGPCQVASCNPKSGACEPTPLPDATACDDGDPCSVGDHCEAGACVAEGNPCACKTAADCASTDDGDLCNGVPYCDLSGGAGVCKTNPATVVQCSGAADTDCRKNQCDPASGLCALTPVKDKTACDDGDTCTKGEFCAGGVCAGGTDTCVCSSDADCAAEEDGNLCNGKLFCNVASGKCEINPSTYVTCSTQDDTVCAKAVCLPESGTCTTLPRSEVKQIGCTAIDLGGGVVAKLCVFAAKEPGEAGDPGPFACEDGDACTEGDLCQGSTCSSGKQVCECATNADCAAKEDGNLCNGTLYCDGLSGKCVLDPLSVVTCPSGDDTACSKNTCSPKTGSCAPQQVSSGTPCDDGNACTSGDACKLGQCAPGKVVCECQQDADCASKEDGDLCNGTLFCDTGPLASGGKPSCKVDPKSVVSCPSGDDTTCSKNLCNPKTGACVQTATAQGTPCDDGDSCTKGDACKLGLCEPGTAACACKTDADCAAKEDGDLCNGTLFCDTTGAEPACKVNPATVVTCSPADDTACLKNLCNPKTGACAPTASASSAPCDDGEPCTQGDACKLGQCVPGKAVCECKVDADCAGKEDGDLCNGTLYCDTSALAQGGLPTCKIDPKSLVTCPSVDDTACTKNLCNPKVGQCQPTALAPGTGCDDGDSCTQGDVCKLGKCQPGTSVCACSTDQDCKAQDDGNLCNGTLFCDKSGSAPACKVNPASVVVCATVDDTTCLKNQCQAKTGVCLPTAVTPGTACDDGDACTSGDVCKLGQCTSGSPSCECQQDADCASKDDGDACNGTWYCDKKGSAPACKPLPNSAVYCASGGDTSCLKNRCDKLKGTCSLQPEPAGTACDDGDACTEETVCKDGSCGNGGKTDCDDGDGCTLDTCDPALGCKHNKKSCEDGNSCTSDGCDSKTGQCDLQPLAKGLSCNADDNGCTVNDACDGKGSCIAGGPLKCVGEVGVCQQRLCVSKSANDFTCVLAVAPDGTSCDTATSCMKGAYCAKGACEAPTFSTLYTEHYGPEAGATRFFDVAALPADEAVLVGQQQADVSKIEIPIRGLVVRLSALGSKVWENHIVGEKEHYGTAATAVVALSGGQVAVAGRALFTGTRLDTFVQRLDANGKVLWFKPFPAAIQVGGAAVALDQAPTELALTSGGNLVVAGTSAAISGVTKARLDVFQVDLAGNLQVQAVREPLEATLTVQDVEVLQDGSIVLALGSLRDDAVEQAAQLRRMAADGTTLWVHDRAVTSETLSSGVSIPVGWTAVRELPDGEWMTIGALPFGKVIGRVLGRRRTDGVERWSSNGSAGVVPFAATSLVAGRIVVLQQNRASPDAGSVELTSVDRWGNVHWSRKLSENEAIEPAAITILSGGGLLMVGRSRPKYLDPSSPQIARGWIRRTDPWGHGDCTVQGLCAGVGWSKCDDGDVCTADNCDGTYGCFHPSASNLRCDPKAGCAVDAACVAGTCTDGHNGRLYAKALPTLDYAKLDRARGLHQDGTRFGLFARPAGSSATSQLLRLDENGQVSDAPYDLDCGSGTLVEARPGTSAGSAWALLTTSTQGVKQARLCRQTSAGASGTPLPSCNGCQGAAVDLVVTPDGGGWALQREDDAGKDRARVHRFSAAGVLGAATQLPLCAAGGCAAGAATLAPAAAAALSDAAVVVASSDTGSGLVRGQINRISVDGTSAWTATLALGHDVHVRAIATGAADRIVVAGRAQINEVVYTPLHASLDSKGKIAWLLAWPEILFGEADAVVAEPDGGLTFAGRITAGVEETPAIWRVDATGKPLWMRQPSLPTGTLSPMPRGLLRLADGYLLLAGASYASTPTIAVLRADPNGYVSCLDAGLCAANKTDACDDGDPCTADACDAKAGCVHKAIDLPGCGG